MKEESNFYRFILVFISFIGFVFVFAYNVYVGNGIDYALLKASWAAFLNFLILKYFIYWLEKARSKPPLKDLNFKNEQSDPIK